VVAGVDSASDADTSEGVEMPTEAAYSPRQLYALLGGIFAIKQLHQTRQATRRRLFQKRHAAKTKPMPRTNTRVTDILHVSRLPTFYLRASAQLLR